MLPKLLGMGRKTAERLIMDMRDRVGAQTQVLSVTQDDAEPRHEAFTALSALGQVFSRRGICYPFVQKNGCKALETLATNDQNKKCFQQNDRQEFTRGSQRQQKERVERDALSP